jgi:predicted transcriptional regulator of viral defense system
MSCRDSQAARQALQAVAARQAGYFTAKQALAAGYPKQHVSYHVAAGNFDRVERGLYRLPAVPPGEHDELVRLTLWSPATVRSRTLCR